MLHQKCLLSAIAVTAVTAFGISGAQADDAKPSFVADGVFSVCQDPTFPPMEFASETDGSPVGVDVDIVKALAERWGVSESTVVMDFNGLLPSLSAERCDAVVSGATLTAERQKTFDGIGYLNTFIVVIAKAGAAPFANMDDLSGKTVAVQSGTTYVDRAEAMNGELTAKGLEPMNIQTYPKQTDAIQQLLVGRVDGVFSQDTEVAYREFQNPGQFSTVWVVPQETFQPYAMYIRKTDGDKAAVEAAVQGLIADGAMDEIIAKWRLQPSQLDGIRK